MYFPHGAGRGGMDGGGSILSFCACRERERKKKWRPLLSGRPGTNNSVRVSAGERVVGVSEKNARALGAVSRHPRVSPCKVARTRPRDKSGQRCGNGSCEALRWDAR